jgi:hypothetical protein
LVGFVTGFDRLIVAKQEYGLPLLKSLQFCDREQGQAFF